MSRTDKTTLPATLAARPWDEKRDIPIPVMNMCPADMDGDAGLVPPVLGGPEGVEWVADYTAIYGPSVYACGEQRRCGLCGEPLGYWVAFLGGPKSAANRAYADPPAHEECLEAALSLCPHIAVPHHKRAPEHRLAEQTLTQAGADLSRTEEWVMGISRDYKMDPARMLFRPAPFKRTRRFTYIDGTLAEVTG